MERRWIKGLMASLAFVQSMGVAHAQEIVVDLPDPFANGESTSTPTPVPVVLPAPPAVSPVQAQFAGAAVISAISRKSGGSTITITLQKALPLLRLELRVLKSQVKIHEAALITARGERVAVREFKESSVLATQTSLISENLNLNEDVAKIVLVAESFQSEADVELKALSQAGVPQLAVQPSAPVQSAPPVNSGVVPPPPPPPPVRPSEPPRTGVGCLDGICIGTRAYNVQRDYREVEVVSIERGTFTLRFLDNGGVGGNWSRTDLALQNGCSADLCVGAPAYRVSNQDTRKVVVVGIEANGRYVLRFEDSGRIGGNWERSDLAVPRGCVNSVCVGAPGYNISRESRHVTVLAVQLNQKLVLRFDDNGGLGGGWDRNDVALPQGCSQNVCVGAMAYNIERDFRLVRVLAVDAFGRFVLRFEDNGGVGGNWNIGSLALAEGCGQAFCVNNEVLVRARDMRRARIVGIQTRGGYVLRFLDNGGVGGGWQDGDLIRAR